MRCSRGWAAQLFVDGLFEARGDLSAFKAKLRDFLVETKGERFRRCRFSRPAT